MTKRLLRFVRRNSGNLSDLDGLIIGGVLRDGHEFFKPGYVYEIVDILGEPVVQEVGPSWVKPTLQHAGARHISWGSSIDNVLMSAGKHLILTEDEYMDLIRATI